MGGAFGFGSQFATPETIVRKAFEQIAAGMTLPPGRGEALAAADSTGSGLALP